MPPPSMQDWRIFLVRSTNHIFPVEGVGAGGAGFPGIWWGGERRKGRGGGKAGWSGEGAAGGGGGGDRGCKGGRGMAEALSEQLSDRAAIQPSGFPTDWLFGRKQQLG